MLFNRHYTVFRAQRYPIKLLAFFNQAPEDWLLYAKKGRIEEECDCSRQKPILLSVGWVKVRSLKPALQRQKTFNCHARQHSSVGSRRLHTDGACVVLLLLLNASTMHEEQWRKEGTVEGGGVQMGKNDGDGKAHTCYTYALASTDIALYQIMCAQINLSNT